MANKLDYLDFEGLNYYDSKIKKTINEKELSLKVSLIENSQAIKQEEERAQNIESILIDDLQSEIDRAEKSEIDLNNKINDETDRLSNIIDDNKIELQTNIDKEEASRIAEIARVESNHSRDLTALDNSLQSFTREQISTSEAKLTTNYQFADESIREDLRQHNSEIYNLKATSQDYLNHKENHNNPHKITREQIGAASKEAQDLLESRTTNLENNTIKNTSTNPQTISSDVVISGNINIEGDLTFNGKAHTIDTETLQVKDNFIIINSDGEELGDSQLSGLSIRIDPNTAYGIVYDKINESVSLGKGTISNGDFTFIENESKPILTRDISNNIRNGAMLIWDSKRNIAIDGGIIDVESIKSEFVPKHDHYALENRVQLNEQNIKNHTSNTNNPHNVKWSHIREEALNSTINPYMDGVVSKGSSNLAARADHIHPTDTSRAPIDHASATNIYGQATTTMFGHVKVDEVLSNTSGNPVQNKIITEALNNKLNTYTGDLGLYKLCGIDKVTGNQRWFNSNPTHYRSGYIPIYENSANATGENKGVIRVASPTESYHSANKQYVDDSINTQINDVKTFITNKINILDLDKINLTQAQTLKSIEQLDGKLSVEVQNIELDIDQVKKLKDEFTQIRSEFASQDKAIEDDFRIADEGIKSTLKDTQNRVKILEDANDITLELSTNISQIKENIKNGTLNIKDKFMLSFNEKLDSAGNITDYTPVFEKLTINNGYLI